MDTVEIPTIFTRRADRFFRKHPDLRARFAMLLVDLQNDPYQPHLRLHKLTRRLDDVSAVGLTYAFRVILVLIVSEQTITLIDIGGHNEVYRS